MIYSLTVEDVATGAVADTYTTLLALVAGSTTGHRGRLLQLIVGPSDNTPQDLNAGVRVSKTNQDTAGTPGSTVSAANIPKHPNERVSTMTGARAYSVEPTTYETYPAFQADMNRRGGMMQAWTREEAPQWGPSETLGILFAPRTDAVARVSATIIWEEW